jgi:CCR4-NOT transcriptional complex subunit CAF120
MYMVIAGGLESSAESISGDPKNKKRTSIFGGREPAGASGPIKPKLSLFTSPKPKDRKKAYLTLTQVTQAFAVYPERPELIPRSTLMKIEGLMGDEQAAGGMRSREGWWLVMPDMESGINVSAELLRWILGEHHSISASPVPFLIRSTSRQRSTTFSDSMADPNRTPGIRAIQFL